MRLSHLYMYIYDFIGRMKIVIEHYYIIIIPAFVLR